MTDALMKDYALIGAVVGSVYVITSALLRWSRSSKPTKVVEEPKSPEFMLFERRYVFAFLLGLSCEYIQASMTFALMRHEHSWTFRMIAKVYALGFAASWATSALSPGERSGHGQCLLCFACYGVAAVLAGRGDGLQAVALSRILAGVAQPLLQTAFDNWMRAMHADSGFPAAWRRSTYELAGTGTTAVSIVSGALAEALRRITASDRRPFDVTVLLSLTGCFVVLALWPTLSESARRASQRTNLCETRDCLPGGAACSRLSSRALCAVVSACIFEATAYVTNATWATALARVELGGRSPYGLVFALLMASAVSGTHLFQLFAATRIERVAVFLSLLAGLAFVLLAIFEAKVGATVANVLFPLFLFQLCSGWSVPIFAAAKGKHVPNEIRKALGRVSTALHGAIVIALILLIPADTQLTFKICAALIVVSLVANIRLNFAST